MANIKKELSSGIFYTAIAKYSGIVISLLVTGILSRLLSPKDFGVVAIATVIIGFFSIFTDMGISPAIIQHKDLSKRDLSEIFSLTILMGVILSGLFFSASWVIAKWYNSPILSILCQLLSINLFFASITIVPGALFYRNKQFKYIAWRSFIIQISTGSIAVGAALSGAGLYALIISPILSAILMFGISFHKYPQKIYFTTQLDALHKIFSYSAYQFLFNIINYFSRNLDKLLIGKYMGMKPLGYYDKSYRLMMLPLQNITHVITPVMHPILSDFQNDLDKLSSSYEKIVRLLAFIGFPLSVFLFFTAKELTLIIFGDQWMPSVPVFQILSISVGIQIILSSSGSIFQASGDTRSMFISGLFSSTLNVISMLAGIFFFGTLEALAVCICISFTINFIQCYWLMYHVTFHRRNLFFFIKQIRSPLIIAVIIGIILLIINQVLMDMNIFLTISVKSILFIITFGYYIQITREYNIMQYIKKWIKK